MHDICMYIYIYIHIYIYTYIHAYIHSTCVCVCVNAYLAVYKTFAHQPVRTTFIYKLVLQLTCVFVIDAHSEGIEYMDQNVDVVMMRTDCWYEPVSNCAASTENMLHKCVPHDFGTDVGIWLTRVCPWMCPCAKKEIIMDTNYNTYNGFHVVLMCIFLFCFLTIRHHDMDSTAL
jgi:hypothetical protein